jgi:hypothetical protein
MSFLLDPPQLVAYGALIESTIRDERLKRALQAGVATTFIAGSTAIYLEAPVAKPLWRLFGERSGRDFMWNSGVFDIDHESRAPGIHLLAAGILATYPLLVRLGGGVV